jgi:hypothetical protein
VGALDGITDVVARAGAVGAGVRAAAGSLRRDGEVEWARCTTSLRAAATKETKIDDPGRIVGLSDKIKCNGAAIWLTRLESA